jgi:hypothetical protein
MLHVDIPTQAEIKALAAARGTVCASLYLPTSPLGQEAEHARLALKNLGLEAVRQMEADGVDKRQIWPIAEQLEHLVDDHDFWQMQARSLAVFVTPEQIRTFRLPNQLEQLVQVADRFHLKPLLRTVTFPHEALVLALSTGHTRVVEVFADLPPQEVRVPGMPKDAMHAVGKATIGHRSPAGRIHGSEGEKVRLRQYSRAVDQSLRGLLGGRETPLILAATRPIDDVFRSVCTYPHLVAQQITQSPDQLTDGQLAEAARPLLDEIYADQMKAQLELYATRKGQGRATTDLAQAARAATFGAVDSLLVDIDEVVPGWVDETDGSIRFAEGHDASSYGIVDEIATRTLAHGGKVLGVRKADLPDGAQLAAILRYPV